MPTLVLPVRKPHWPVMNEERPGRAALLGVIVGENHALSGDAVNVGSLEAHQSHRVGADIGLADVVAPDDDDVGFLLLRVGGRPKHYDREGRCGHEGHRFEVLCSSALQTP